MWEDSRYTTTLVNYLQTLASVIIMNGCTLCVCFLLTTEALDYHYHYISLQLG